MALDNNGSVESLSKRYIIKLISTIITTVVGAILPIVLPMAFTTEEYADYTFNLNVFTAVVSIAFLSMDGAFAAKISKRIEEVGIIKLYGKYILLVLMVLNVGVAVVLCSDLSDNWLINQGGKTVLLAINAAFSLKIIQEVISLYDCYALTRISETAYVIQKVSFTTAILLLYWLNILNLTSFYVVQIMMIVIFVVVMIGIFVKRNAKLFSGFSKVKSRPYIPEFVEFCRPMIVSTIVANLIMIVSNYVLKKYGGNSEEAYYGVAWQLNTLIVYTFTPIIALLRREYAIRAGKPEILSRFYEKIMILTIVIVSFFASFILVNSRLTLQALYGDKYLGAVVITQLIMIYTVFQAWGQVNGALFTATERTKIYATLSIVMQVITFVCIFIFQIPNGIWPEGLGSMGMGLQMVTTNIISVMLLSIANSRYMKLNLIRTFIMPLLSVAFFSGMAFVSKFIGKFCLFGEGLLYIRLQFLLTGIIYVVINAFIVFAIAAVRKESIKDIVKGLMN